MSETRETKLLGPWMSTAMVVGFMIGSGIFLLPATLAPYGRNALFAWGVTIGGTMCLALAFARLSARNPGGPQAYVADAFGNDAAFYTMWSYWISVITSVAALGVAFAGAMTAALPALIGPAWLVPLAVAAIAAVTLVNLRGAYSAGGFQVVTTLIKLLPLVAVIVVLALRLGGGGHAEALAPTPISGSGIASASALMLFSLLGFEAASVAARKTRDPERVVPLATLAGTGITGLIYFAACTAAILLLPVAAAAVSTSPFADAIAPVWGSGAGQAIAALTAVSAIGAMNAGVLVQGEVGWTLAQSDDLPPALARTNAQGAPVAALIVTGLLAMLFVAFNASRSFVGLYVFITLISTVASLVLYAGAAAAALKITLGPLTRLLVSAGFIYAIWTFYGAGLEACLWGLALLAAGWPVRLISQWFNSRAATTPAAAPAPAAPRE